MMSWFRSQAKLIQQQYSLNLCVYTNLHTVLGPSLQAIRLTDIHKPFTQTTPPPPHFFYTHA